MPHILPPEALAELASRDEWALDNDDFMYEIASGFHARVKDNIVATYNRRAAQEPRLVRRVGDILAQQGAAVADPAVLTPAELGLAFPPVVQALSEIYPNRLQDDLNLFYGEDYARIAPAPALVEAFGIAHDKGIRIHFYTNGPSAPGPGETGHLQKTMRRLGFDESAIERMRSRTYDLLMAIAAGRGKPAAESMRDFLAFSGIDPKKALMGDDSVKNLETARAFGMSALWGWTTDAPPPPAAAALARNIGAHRVRDTGQALLAIARAHRN